MREQKLTKVDAHLRNVIRLTTDSNRRMAENHQREQKRRRGRGACTWCGAQSCGHLWSRPGDTSPGGERCCDRCSHEAVEGWQHTHTAWDGAVAYPVCGVVMREGDVVYMRRDGVVEFLEMRAPAPGAGIGGAQLEEVPTVAFLGADGGVALYVAGEGDSEHVNLWEKKRDLDIVWLPIRMQASVSRDEQRKEKLAVEIAEAAAKWEREENERRQEEAEKRAADIEKRQLKHETVTVLREQQAVGGTEDEAEDDDEEEVEMPDDGSDRQPGGRSARGQAHAGSAERARTGEESGLWTAQALQAPAGRPQTPEKGLGRGRGPAEARSQALRATRPLPNPHP